MPRRFDRTAASFYGEFVPAPRRKIKRRRRHPISDGYGLVAWIQMRDFIVESTKRQFYGFIAQSAADRGRQ
jgi:hypothetical protein